MTESTKGFSLRQHLIDSGVTTSEALQLHLHRAYLIKQALPSVRLTRYRVDANNPNRVPGAAAIPMRFPFKPLEC